MIAGAISVGITTDEPTQVMRTQGWLDQGWYVPLHLLAGGEPRPIAAASPYVYGPAYAAVAHAVNIFAGNEESGEIATTAAAWETRHLVVALIGLLTVAASGFAVWLLTASRRFAVWTAAALLAFPIWLGMSFFNPKDVPVAAGYTLFTVGLMLALARGSRVDRTRSVAVAIAGLVALGFYLGAGTRPVLWVALVGSAATFAVLTWGRRRFGGAPRDRIGSAAVLAGILVGVLAIAVSYPAAFSSPLDLLTRSLSDSAHFAWTGFTLTAGRLLPEHPPWWYLPAWAFASSPVLILALSVGGAVRPFRLIASPRRGSVPCRLRAWLGSDDAASLLVFQQALLMSVGSVVIGAQMYSGLRQHLYLVPPLAILAGVGADWIWGRVSAGGRRWRRAAIALLISAALAVPMAEEGLLFPYDYAYVNPIAGIGGINGRWETDYWWASSREALSRLPAAATPYCGALAFTEPGGATDPDVVDCSLAPMIGPFLDERHGAPAGQPQSSSRSIWMLSRNHLVRSIPAGCRQERDVTRWLRGEEVLMSYVLVCDRSLAPKPAP